MKPGLDASFLVAAEVRSREDVIRIPLPVVLGCAVGRDFPGKTAERHLSYLPTEKLQHDFHFTRHRGHNCP